MIEPVRKIRLYESITNQLQKLIKEGELKPGDQIIFKDMIHYTMVKTTMFNGVNHPAIAIWTEDDQLKIVREFTYEDFKGRLS